MNSPYWYEDFSVDNLKDVLLSADDEKLTEFENALLNERERREGLKSKSFELLESLQITIENIEDENFIVTYDGFPIRFSRFDVKPNYNS